MQKKLIAIAVAGVLGAPAMALAQTSTVNVYGSINYEYGFGDSGQFRHSTDYAGTPGGSAIGFRGEEKLGRGLSAWFQCESSADVRGVDQVGFCSRNSAVGFKGAFGNLHFGRWDTPMKRALNQGTVGAYATGLLGMSFIAFGGSGGADATGTGSDSVQRQRWKRREASLTYYETPNFNGLQGLFAFSPGNRASDLPVGPFPDANPKPRIWSLAGTYIRGPLRVGVGYEKHAQFGAHQGAATRLDDTGWGVSAAYTFARKVKVGFTYLDTEYETGIGRTADKKIWTVGVDWSIVGPHSFHAQYANAGDTKGNSLIAINANGGVDPSGPDTGADAWSLAYQYAFSKRTKVRFGYVRFDNDNNSNLYRVGNTPSLLVNGQNVDAFAFHVSHRF